MMKFVKDSSNDGHYIVFHNHEAVGDIVYYTDNGQWYFEDRDILGYTKDDLNAMVEFMRTLL